MISDIDARGLPGLAADHPGMPQLLVFSAGWCAPCKAMMPALEDIAQMYRGRIAIARIDIEADAGLAVAFAVRGVPTLVGRVDGRECRRIAGRQNKTRLALLADALIAMAATGTACADGAA